MAYTKKTTKRNTTKKIDIEPIPEETVKSLKILKSKSQSKLRNRLQRKRCSIVMIPSYVDQLLPANFVWRVEQLTWFIVG